MKVGQQMGSNGGRSTDGNHDAQLEQLHRHLGVLLQDLGRVEEAVGWYRQAADAGDVDAADALARLESERQGPPGFRSW
jgi:TPR repeat protein